MCTTCAPDLLDAKREGILAAMRLLTRTAGADVLPAHAPITFHLDDDDVCGTAGQMMAEQGYVTGFLGVDSNGRWQACLFDVEKANRTLPFTPENARSLDDQVLPLHEAMHAWFDERENDAQVQEPFAVVTALVLSGTVPDPCTGFRVNDAPDSLIPALCDIGFTVDKLPEVLRRTADEAREGGRPLDSAEMAALVSSVIGADATGAFRNAGLL